MLEADSCCKSSHSWRAPGSPRLICRTSNITNHLGVGNTSLSSSLSLFVFFPSLSLFCCLSRCHFLPSRLLSCSLSNSPSLVLSLTCSAGKTSGEHGAERWDCFVSFVMPGGNYSRHDDTRNEREVPLLLFPLNSHFLSFLFFICKHNCHSRTSAPPPC